MLPGDGGFAGRTFAFVGRASELAALKRAAVSHLNYKVLNVHGPGGIGKTRLLYRVAQDLGGLGACVIWVNAREVEPSEASIADALIKSLDKAAATPHPTCSSVSPSPVPGFPGKESSWRTESARDGCARAESPCAQSTCTESACTESACTEPGLSTAPASVGSERTESSTGCNELSPGLSASQSAAAETLSTGAGEKRDGSVQRSDGPARALRGEDGPSLEHALSSLASVANTRQTVIVIDDYEVAPAFDDLFRRSILPVLDPRILVVVTSWHPITRLWESDPASLSQARCLALGYLAPQEVEELLHCSGIRDQAALDRIILFAGGHPLALVLAADAELDAECTELCDAERRGRATYREVAHEVFRRITREIHDGDVMNLLETACVVRRCNEELLSHLAGRPITAMDINRLTCLSFVHLTEEGVRIDDEIGNVVLEDMKWRAPGRLASLRRLATDWFRGGQGGNGPSDVIEHMFLAPDPLLRRYFFTEWGDLSLVRDGAPPKPEELAEVYRAWLKDYLGRKEDTLGEIDQVSRLLELFPDRFIAVRERDGRLAGFTCIIPVDERSLPVLLRSEVTRLCVDNLPGMRDASHVLIFPFIMVGAHAYQVRAALVKAVFEWQERNEVRAVFITWVHDETAASRAEQLRFRRMQKPVCLAYGQDTPVTYCYLDLTKTSARSWIDEVLGRQGGAPDDGLSQHEMIQEVVLCLRHFWDDHELGLSRMAHFRLVIGRIAQAREEGKTAGSQSTVVPAAIRSVLRDALALLAEGTGRFAFRFGAEEAKMIRMAYIDRVGSHECVMERLGFPRTTYYRRLRQALRNLATILVSLEDEQDGR